MILWHPTAQWLQRCPMLRSCPVIRRDRFHLYFQSDQPLPTHLWDQVILPIRMIQPSPVVLPVLHLHPVLLLLGCSDQPFRIRVGPVVLSHPVNRKDLYRQCFRLNQGVRADQRHQDFLANLFHLHHPVHHFVLQDLLIRCCQVIPSARPIQAPL
jgi:hypothetical protein